MLSNKKPNIEKYLEPFILPISGINPNVLTLIGSIPPLLFFVFVIKQMYMLAGVAFFGNIIDALDGMIARKYNKATSFGGFLDSTIDRVGDFLMISAFSYAGIIRWEITAPLLMLSFLISYVRSRGELASGNKIKFSIGIVERTERLAFIFFALITYLLYPAVKVSGFSIPESIFILLLALSFVTFAQRMQHAYKYL